MNSIFEATSYQSSRRMSQRTSAYAFLWDYHTRCKHEGSIPHDDLRADAFASLSTISKLKLYSRTQRDGLNDLKATASACPPSFQPWNNKQHICFVDPLEVSPILSKKTTLKRQAGDFHNQRHKRNDASGREDSSSRVANHSSNSRKKPQLRKNLSKRWICTK